MLFYLLGTLTIVLLAAIWKLLPARPGGDDDE